MLLHRPVELTALISNTAPLLAAMTGKAGPRISVFINKFQSSSLPGVFRYLAGIAKGLSNTVSHRLRDTFAVELLLAGVPIERPSMLLGHQSIRVTEKHYAPWTRSRQEQIESDLTAAWKTDPMLSKKAGTKGVQIQKGPVTVN